MSSCIHWWLLTHPVGDVIPSTCKLCGEAKNWRAIGVRAEGRPFITRDPLLARTLVGGYGLPQYY